MEIPIQEIDALLRCDLVAEPKAELKVLKLFSLHADWSKQGHEVDLYLQIHIWL